MSKRAGAVPEETRERILAAAREEFSERGFQGSSLRRICAAAGVTTGALYFFFQGKEELFRKVLAQATEPLSRLVEEHYRQERMSSGRDTKEGGEADFAALEELIGLYFRDQQTWDILIRHLSHPAVREFLDRSVDTAAEHYRYLLEEMPGRPVDSFAVHQFAHMQADTVLTLFSHGFSREEMVRHSRTVVRMLRGAFRALLTD